MSPAELEATAERLHGIVAGLCPPGVGVDVEYVIARREWVVRLVALDRRVLPYKVEIRYDAEDEAPSDKAGRRVAVPLDADALRDGVERALEMLAVAVGHPGCWER